MSFKTFQISPKAKQDLKKILKYGLLNYLSEIAHNYHDGFYDVFNLLVKFPEMGTQYAEDDQALRKYTYQKNHIIIYRIKTDHIYILRILHGRQNIAEIFDYWASKQAIFNTIRAYPYNHCLMAFRQPSNELFAWEYPLVYTGFIETRHVEPFSSSIPTGPNPLKKNVFRPNCRVSPNKLCYEPPDIRTGRNLTPLP